ncbi:MAG: nucleotide exchange factor GrpE [Proteobacteria bacterium]|nr:nucleotide exchange factor GrpE [Pseudomonadota bacterium]
MNGQTDRPEEEPEDESVNDGANDAESTEQEETPEAAMAELKARADDNWDRYLRAAAETENVRKRASRDVEHARKYALEGFGTEMLAVKDSLELGLEAVESADADSIAEGSKATLKLLSAALERFGIAEIDPMGEPFDPERHEAINMQPSADAEPGSVLSVVQKGYSLNGRLLRPAMVVVAAETSGESPSDSEAE